MNKKGFYQSWLKRNFDIVGSLIGLVILSPLFLVVSLLVKYNLGAPILFFQPRPGLNEKVFYILKFRTMRNDFDEYGNLLPDNKRLTKFGSFLRSTSIDELPSLINILKGDMSIVGPRPLLVKYLPLYNNRQKKRHIVRPGLTGLSQINGRNKISWEQRFDYDLEYIKNINFLSDIIIIFKTIFKVVYRKNINSDKDITMEEFKGEN